MQFSEMLIKRQATRKFGDKMPDKQALDAVLEAGRMAPTAKNIQPIKIYVAQSEAAIAAIDKASPNRYGARTVLVVCSDKDAAYSHETHNTMEIDASIVTTYLMLAATEQGLDSIWIERFDRKVMAKELGMPENIVPISMLPIGYRADDCPTSRNYLNRKPIEDIVEYK